MAAPTFPVGPIYLTTTSASNQTWPVPSDWNNASNTVQVIAAGGGGGGVASNTTGRGGGGGGGGYSKSVNITLSGSTATYFLPAGGTGGGTSGATAGGDAWFNGAACAAASVCAKGGGAGGAGTGGGGGAAGAGGSATGGVASGTGSIKNSGGAGGAGMVISGGGGGGAGGPSAAGVAGNSTNGGQGDGTAGGTGGITSGIRAAFPGNAGTEFSSSPAYGSGGGGGGSGYAADAGAGGTYGAGGGGAFAPSSGTLRRGGAGAPGLIVINYSAPLTVSITAPTNSGNSCIGTPGAFTVTRNGPATWPAVSVDLVYGGSGSTAVVGTDYSAAPATVTIPANTMSVVVPITALQKTSGGSTTLKATIAASSAYSVGTPASATITINNGTPAIETVSPYAIAPFAAYPLPYNGYIYHQDGGWGYTNQFATPTSILNAWITNSPSPQLCGTNGGTAGISLPSDTAQGVCMGPNFSTTVAGTRVAVLQAVAQTAGIAPVNVGLDLTNVKKTNPCNTSTTHWAYATAPTQNTPAATLKVPKYTPVQFSYQCLPNQNYVWFGAACQGAYIISCLSWTLVTDGDLNVQTADRAWYKGTETANLIDSSTQTFSNSQSVTLQCGGYQPQEGIPANGGSPPAASSGTAPTGGSYTIYGMQNPSYRQPQIQVDVQTCSDPTAIVQGGVCVPCNTVTSGSYRSGNTCVLYPPPTATIQANNAGFQAADSSGNKNGKLVSVGVGQQVTVAATYAGSTNQTQKTVFITAAGSGVWTVPSDWNSANNSIEVIGGGGTSAFTGGRGGGGGGGAYSKKTNVSLTHGASVAYRVGQGAAQGNPASPGGDTFFNRTAGSSNTCVDTVSVCAKGGNSGNGNNGGAGGAVSGGVGTVKYAGGAGAYGDNNNSGNGGGAGGPNGNGQAGDSGGAGDAGLGGAGSGCGNPPAAGGNGAEWIATNVWNGSAYTGATPTAGSGGGGGCRSSIAAPGGNGGLYGGGGGSGGGSQSNEGVGAQGIIVIKYTSTGDPLEATAINCDSGCDSQDGNTVNCNLVAPPNPPAASDPNCWQKPDATKTYTFTPASADAGKAFVFSAQAKTFNYINYNGYATVQVKVCAVGQASDGNGGCVPDMCTNLPGFQTTVPSGCTGNPDNTCSVPSGYAFNGSACVPSTPSVPTLSANSFTATRVRLGGSSTLSWNIPGMANGISCSISPTPASGTAGGDITSLWNGSSNPFTGTATTQPITQPTKYTLTCTNNQDPPSTRSITVQLIPNYQEI
ncbi:MAG TPA: hypothetical protein VHD31_00335 [Candidatus Paceibacterota bacterium]|nr:hypothetical protein [Candidatus Paceibacterota bacterium]